MFLIESILLKKISFIFEIKLKALSWILLMKLLDGREQNIHKSGQVLNWPLMKDLKRVLFGKGLRILAIFVKALSLLPTFLQKCFTFLSSLRSLSIIYSKILFTKVFFILKFLYIKISSSDRFDPKHIKLHFPGLRAI